MSDITAELTKVFADHSGAPFLFVGSGLSRRYIGLEDWEALLARFSEKLFPFGKYKSEADGSLPKAAQLLAADFNKMWWAAEEYSSSREQVTIIDQTSTLRHEICSYLLSRSNLENVPAILANELQLLRQLNVDGIITTNWDVFLEAIFPEYKVFVGQEQLLFSSPFSVAEIYKIHGCATRPSSIVLTESDYQAFDSKNPYLAAKLITTFVEHPIVFLGYSVSDENIQKIISAIAKCLSGDQLNRFGKNLVFVNRLKDGQSEGISDFGHVIEGAALQCLQVRTDDFSKVYDAIIACKRKIPARMVRYFREEMHQIVQTGALEKKIRILDADAIKKNDGIEFFVGVGVKGAKIGSIGYQRIKIAQIFDDYFSDAPQFDPHSLLSITVKQLSGSTKNIPIFKYLSALGIDSRAKLKDSEYAFCERYLPPPSTKTIIKEKEVFIKSGYENRGPKWVSEKLAPYRAALHLTFFAPSVDVENEVKRFIEKHKAILVFDKKLRGKSLSTQGPLRALGCHYDRLLYGFSN